MNAKRAQQSFLVIAASLMVFFSCYSLSKDVRVLRGQGFYLALNEVLSFPTQDRLKVWRMLTRNTNIPNFGLLYLSETWKNKIFLQQGFITCIEYYEDVQREWPQLQEAGLFKGVFEYYMGRRLDAINTLKIAVKGRPDLFWIPYDLGIINLEYKRFDLADVYFEMALKIPVNKAFDTMDNSILYRQILPKMTAQDIMTRLQMARERSVLIRAMIYKSPANIDSDTLKNMGFIVNYF